jgi:hypothetical protein
LQEIVVSSWVFSECSESFALYVCDGGVRVGTWLVSKGRGLRSVVFGISTIYSRGKHDITGFPLPFFSWMLPASFLLQRTLAPRSNAPTPLFGIICQSLIEHIVHAFQQKSGNIPCLAEAVLHENSNLALSLLLYDHSSYFGCIGSIDSNRGFERGLPGYNC